MPTPADDARILEHWGSELLHGNSYASVKLMAEVEDIQKNKDYLAAVQKQIALDRKSDTSLPDITIVGNHLTVVGQTSEGMKEEQFFATRQLGLETGLVDPNKIFAQSFYHLNEDGSTSHYKLDKLDDYAQKPKLDYIASAPPNEASKITFQWRDDLINRIDLPDGSSFRLLTKDSPYAPGKDVTDKSVLDNWNSFLEHHALQYFDKNGQPVMDEGRPLTSYKQPELTMGSGAIGFGLSNGTHFDWYQSGVGADLIIRPDNTTIKFTDESDYKPWSSFIDSRTNHTYSRSANGAILETDDKGNLIDTYSSVYPTEDGNIFRFKEVTENGETRRVEDQINAAGETVKIANANDIQALVHFDTGVSPALQQQLLAELKALPQNVQDALVKKGTFIEFAPPNLSPLQNGTGVFRSNENRIIITTNGKFEKEALAHEIAHAFDDNGKITLSKGFAEAIQTDLNNLSDFPSDLDIGMVDPPMFHTNKYSIGGGDVYAELAAYLWGQNQTDTPVKLSKYFPHLRDYLLTVPPFNGQEQK